MTLLGFYNRQCHPMQAAKEFIGKYSTARDVGAAMVPPNVWLSKSAVPPLKRSCSNINSKLTRSCVTQSQVVSPRGQRRNALETKE